MVLDGDLVGVVSRFPALELFVREGSKSEVEGVV